MYLEILYICKKTCVALAAQVFLFLMLRITNAFEF